LLERSSIAVDLDGTLLRSDRTVGHINAAALHGAHAAGLTIVLATSRGPGGLRRILADLDFGVLAATYGGALLLDATDPKQPRQAAPDHRLDPVDAEALLRAGERAGASTHWYVHDSWYVKRIDATVDRQATITGETPDVVAAFDHLPAPPQGDGDRPHTATRTSASPPGLPAPGRHGQATHPRRLPRSHLGQCKERSVPCVR
jgi:hydroxymethylpyrimidine pyrophosphatase-like HAD family hydrolase